VGFDKLSLTGKVAVVIGGTSGIGRSCAHGFAQAGARAVVASSRRADEVSKAAAELGAMGVETFEKTVDVTSKPSLEALCRAAVDRFGRVDVMLNAAGRTKKQPTVELSEEDYDAILDCNLKGSFLACQVFGRRMIEQGKGKIINIASLGSYVSLSEAVPYCISKSGVAMLTKCLGSEWATKGVNVNAIAPGVFRTPLNTHLLDLPDRKTRILGHTPMQRFGDVEELKGAAIFLASDAADFVTGEILAVDGGFLAMGI